MRTVSVVKTVIECPEGKLLWPDSFSPIITKPLLSNTAAGLGTANIFFSRHENIREISDAVIKVSQTRGAYTINSVRNEKKIRTSPNWVRLYCVLGNCDNFELRKKKLSFWICVYDWIFNAS